MSHSQKAVDYFKQGYNCCQSVFAAFADEMNLDFETALRLSSSFGGGMGRLREVCGAVSGMFMVAGMLYGYCELDDTKKMEHYKLIQELANKFKQKNYDTIICRELLKELSVDSSPIPSKRDAEYYKVRPCVKFVEDATEILDELILSKE
ncbi:MAG: C-GCAxxG-C-C family protein [Oscillospiraceae bacterium]